MVSAICQAKDPSTCRYHGAQLRMLNAQKTGDFNQYYEARKIVEQLENKGWEEPTQEKVNNLLDNQTQQATEWLPTRLTPTLVQKVDPATTTIYPANEHHPEWEGIPTTNHEDAQNGELLNKIIVFDPNIPDDQGTLFTRHKPNDIDTFPDYPYQIRVQFNRPITSDEAKHLAQHLGYTYRATVAGESISDPQQDTPHSFIVYADTTKTARDDIGMAIEKLEEDYPHIIQNGSPLRTTDRAGAGTKGTRLIEPVDQDIQVSFYYDS